MSQRVLTVGVLLALASPAWAQQQTAPAAPADAVELGERGVALRVAQVAPAVYLTPFDRPAVIPLVFPQVNLYAFEVQVPTLNQTGVRLVSMTRPPLTPRQPDPATSAAAVQPVANSAGRVSGAGGDVAPDPMTPVLTEALLNSWYVTAVKDALLDAILDQSAVLPLKADDVLGVVASATDVAGQNPLYKETPTKLYLEIKGSDLLDLRQNRITREEARRRITERHF